MKPSLLFVSAALAIGVPPPTQAATTSVIGGLTIKGVAPGNTIATLSFIQLNVLNPGHVRIEASYLGGLSDIYAYLFTGVPYGELTVNVGSPFQLIIGTPGLPGFEVADGFVPTGSYLLGVDFLGVTDWDWTDGFVPTTTVDRGNLSAYFRFDISGDVQPVAFWEGQVDGTFKVTALPEPTTSSAAAIGMGALLARRRRSLRRSSSP